jgi:hypothetical protein
MLLLPFRLNGNINAPIIECVATITAINPNLLFLLIQIYYFNKINAIISEELEECWAKDG